jgi:hypothetical protein
VIFFHREPTCDWWGGLLYQRWILGFRSGVSFADSHHDLLGNLDAATITAWVDDCCRDNSLLEYQQPYRDETESIAGSDRRVATGELKP